MKRTGLQRFRNMMLDNICVKRQQDVLLFALFRLRFQTSHCTVCPLEAFSNLTTSQSFALDTTKTSHIVHYFLIPWLTLISQSNGKGSKTLVRTFCCYRRGVPPHSAKPKMGHQFFKTMQWIFEYPLPIMLYVCEGGRKTGHSPKSSLSAPTPFLDHSAPLPFLNFWFRGVNGVADHWWHPLSSWMSWLGFLNPSNVASEFLQHLVVCTSSESGSAYFLKVNA